MTFPHHHAVTVAFIVAITVITVLFNVYMKFAAGKEATISCVLYDGACKNPIITFGLGLLIGHIFWPVR